MNLERAVSAPTKRAEVTSIEGEDVPRARVLGQDHEGRVRVVQIGVRV
jgi:hypothetical protein